MSTHLSGHEEFRSNTVGWSLESEQCTKNSSKNMRTTKSPLIMSKVVDYSSWVGIIYT